MSIQMQNKIVYHSLYGFFKLQMPTPFKVPRWIVEFCQDFNQGIFQINQWSPYIWFYPFMRMIWLHLQNARLIHSARWIYTTLLRADSKFKQMFGNQYMTICFRHLEIMERIEARGYDIEIPIFYLVPLEALEVDSSSDDEESSQNEDMEDESETNV